MVLVEFLRLHSDGQVDENISVFSPFVLISDSKSTPQQAVRTAVHVHRKDPV